jgi:hypothetical protein
MDAFDGWKNFHYFNISSNNKQVTLAIKQWLNQINRIITKSYLIDQNTEDAVNYSLQIFEKVWKIIGVIETATFKKYIFACYSIVMKYMYDKIDSNVMFKKLGYKFAGADILSAEFEVLDLLKWKIELS